LQEALQKGIPIITYPRRIYDPGSGPNARNSIGARDTFCEAARLGRSGFAWRSSRRRASRACGIVELLRAGPALQEANQDPHHRNQHNQGQPQPAPPECASSSICWTAPHRVPAVEAAHR